MLFRSRVSAWGGNLSRGGSEVFVVEADEYDRSFLALTPTVAVVTNVEADHLDIYRDLQDIHQTFSTYVSRARYVVLCADDPGANALPSYARRPLRWQDRLRLFARKCGKPYISEQDMRLFIYIIRRLLHGKLVSRLGVAINWLVGYFSLVCM